MAVLERVAKDGNKGPGQPGGRDMTQDTATAPNQGNKPPKGNKEPTETGLYADYKKVHPKKVTGLFRTLKNWSAIILLGIYVIGPWLRWDRGTGAPDQAILLDLAAGNLLPDRLADLRGHRAVLCHRPAGPCLVRLYLYSNRFHRRLRDGRAPV
jgi:hypothetical protein